jgi:hypothetical protein
LEDALKPPYSNGGSWAKCGPQEKIIEYKYPALKYPLKKFTIKIVIF